MGAVIHTPHVLEARARALVLPMGRTSATSSGRVRTGASVTRQRNYCNAAIRGNFGSLHWARSNGFPWDSIWLGVVLASRYSPNGQGKTDVSGTTSLARILHRRGVSTFFVSAVQRVLGVHPRALCCFSWAYRRPRFGEVQRLHMGRGDVLSAVLPTGTLAIFSGGPGPTGAFGTGARVPALLWRPSRLFSVSTVQRVPLGQREDVPMVPSRGILATTFHPVGVV